MVKFVSIKAFRIALREMLAVKRGVYANVPAEICNAFKNVSIEEIRQNRDMILIDNESITIKLRLGDKRRHLSKAEGYRLLYIVMKNIPVVGLLTVYPKRGPLQKIDLENDELETLLNAFSAESIARQVVVHDINDNLKAIQES